jgi:adenylate cyclase
MPDPNVNRKLAAILSADVVGYSRLMQDDDAATVTTLQEYRAAIARVIERHKGRVVNAPGDNILAEFPSAIEAVECADEIQKVLQGRNLELPVERRMEFRIGVNLGDVIEEEDGTIYGDGVNIAARMEALAEAGGICISSKVLDEVEGKLDFGFDFLGEQPVKNIEKPVRVYRVRGAASGGIEGGRAGITSRRPTAIIAVAATAVVLVGGVLFWTLYPKAPPQEPELATEEVAGEPATEATPLVSDKASVAVLPLDNLSTDPAHAFLADGLHENIISTLSQVQRLFVPARYSTLQYKDADADIAEVAHTLGVAHVLEGSVQVVGDRVRITTQLIETATGGHLWAERYDRPLDDVLALQDEISLAVVKALQVQLTEGAQAALEWRGGTTSLEAWALCEEGLKHLLKFTKDDTRRARELWERAVTIDPNYGLALGRLGFADIFDYQYGWNTDPSVLARAKEYADKLISSDPDWYYGSLLMLDVATLHGDHEAAIKWGEQAVSLAPNGADPRAHLALTLTRAGQTERALSMIDAAMRLSPLYPDWYLVTKAEALMLAGATDEAADLFTEYDRRAPSNVDMVYMFPIALAKAGRVAEAKAAVERSRVSNPDFSIEAVRKFADGAWHYKDPAVLESHLEALRSIGVPEHPPRAGAKRPSIAVLPFENLSGDPEQDYFAQGFGIDLSTMLGRYPGFQVAARGAGTELTGADPRKVAAELNVNFVLGGSVRRAGDIVRMEAYLADASGRQLWAKQYDRDLTVENLFAIQDGIARDVIAEIATVNGVIIKTLLSDVATTRTTDLTAYQCVLRAGVFYNHVNESNHAEIRECLESAVAADPTYADAWAELAEVYYLEHLVGLNQRPNSLQRALDAGERALMIDPAHPRAIEAVAGAYFSLHELDRFFELAERALAQHVDNPGMLSSVGYQIAYAGQWERGISLLNRALELYPNHESWIFIPLSLDKYRQGDYEGALAYARRVGMSDYWRDAFVTTIALAQLGRLDKAKESLARMLDLNPAFAEDPRGDCRKLNWSEDLIDHILDGFAKAGLEIPPDPSL